MVESVKKSNESAESLGDELCKSEISTRMKSALERAFAMPNKPHIEAKLGIPSMSRKKANASAPAKPSGPAP